MRARTAATSPDWPGLIESLSNRITPRGKSLIMTVFGDSILPHGGGAWLGDLIALLEPLGLNERVVRTSVYRLVQDDPLAARQVGRRSFYALTENGTRQSLEASRRIYARRAPSFDGTWTQVWFPGSKDDAHCELSDPLTRLGFGAMAPGMMIRQGDATAIAAEAAARHGASREIVILQARALGEDGGTAPAFEKLAKWWPLDMLEAEYAEFLDLAGAPLDAISARGIPDAETCFLLRSLLIHAYRRIALKDPMLPVPLLPGDWPGLRAERVMATLYQSLSETAQGHVMAKLNGINRPFGAPGHGFSSRFKV